MIERSDSEEQMMGAASTGRFAGKVAVVTGASSGIGRATALAFAREGASVVVADVATDGNQETARMIDEAGGRSLAVSCDGGHQARHGRHAKSAALDYAAANIRINAICSGIIDTEMMDRFTGGTPEGRAEVPLLVSKRVSR